MSGAYIVDSWMLCLLISPILLDYPNEDPDGYFCYSCSRACATHLYAAGCKTVAVGPPRNPAMQTPPTREAIERRFQAAVPAGKRSRRDVARMRGSEARFAQFDP